MVLSNVYGTLGRGLALALTMAAGCGTNEACEKFADHLADVLTTEQGGDVAADVREKMVKKTVESCSAEPPSKKALECAMQATSSEAMKACEGGGQEGGEKNE